MIAGSNLHLEGVLQIYSYRVFRVFGFIAFLDSVHVLGTFYFSEDGEFWF